MAASIQQIPLCELDTLKLIGFRCTPGVGDAAAVQATIQTLTHGDLEDLAAIVLAARDGSLTVGLAVAHPLDSSLHTWNVPVLAVRNAWQGDGIGRRLKLDCLDAIRACGGDRVISSVHSDNPAMNRINQLLPGAVWQAEVSSPGIFYSIDLTVFDKAPPPPSEREAGDPAVTPAQPDPAQLPFGT